MSELSHFQLFFWIKSFLTSLNLHEIFHCLLLIFWWLSSDCLYLMWCIHYVLILQSFYILHALSLQFSLLMFETFLKLLESLNLSYKVQCLCFSACKATWLNFIASSTCLQFLEKSDWLTSFVSFSFHFFSLFSSKSYVFYEVMINHL